MKLLITLLTTLCFSRLCASPNKNELTPHEQNKELCRAHFTELKMGSNRANDLFQELKGLQKSGQVKQVMRIWKSSYKGFLGDIFTDRHFGLGFLAIRTPKK